MHINATTIRIAMGPNNRCRQVRVKGPHSDLEFYYTLVIGQNFSTEHTIKIYFFVRLACSQLSGHQLPSIKKKSFFHTNARGLDHCCVFCERGVTLLSFLGLGEDWENRRSVRMAAENKR